jgi:hypothetical protein
MKKIKLYFEGILMALLGRVRRKEANFIIDYREDN